MVHQCFSIHLFSDYFMVLTNHLEKLSGFWHVNDSNDDGSVYGLCITMGPNEFWEQQLLQIYSALYQ